MDEKLHKKLEDRGSKGTLRSLSSFDGAIDFISNDYLGLSSFKVESDLSGSTGSRLISGNSVVVESVEASLASFYNYQSALCFNSGYDANLGIMSAIPQKGDIVLYDEYIHASVRDGVRLSHAKSYSFRHNDVEDLQRLLGKYSVQTCYVVIESLYSMHGDIAPLCEIAKSVEEAKAYLIVDEAHAGGIFGDSGRGLTDEFGIDKSVFIKLITYGKAYGGHGACVLAEDQVRDYLINFCRPFIYSTALPESSYVRMESVSNMDITSQREKLFENINYFVSKTVDMERLSDPRSPIQIIRGEKDQLIRQVENLARVNIATKAIFNPTVPEGQECLRICLHSFNSQEEIDLLISQL